MSSTGTPHTVAEDARWFARLCAGDVAAYDEIYRHWRPPLVRFAERLLGTSGAAEEMVQDTLLELWRRRHQLDPRGALAGWLYRSVRNRALNQLRHQRTTAGALPRLVADADRQPHTTPQELAEQADLARALTAAIAELPPRCREVFLLSRTHGLRHAEIAAQLGLSVKSVEAQVGRALRRLRVRLAPFLDPQDR